MSPAPALRALIVDDQRFNRTLLRHTLTNLSFTTTEAVDGDEALRLLDAQVFDAVFLDWELPGANKGDRVAREIRQTARHGHTLLIAITTDTSDAMRARCEAAGTDAFLGKSLDAANVQVALAHAAKKHGINVCAEAGADECGGLPSLDNIASRVRVKLAEYARIFPGGLPAALENCRGEIALEQQRMQAAIALAAWTDAARAAHNIRSLSAMLDLNEIHQAAQLAETTLRTGDATAVPAPVAKLNALLNQACNALADAKV